MSTAEIYDPASGQWRLIATMTEERIRPALFALPTGQVLAIGGNTAGKVTAELFTP